MGVLAAYYQGNNYLEEGILAELDGKANPEMFRAALSSYESSARQMVVLQQKYDRLLEVDQKGKKVDLFEKALGNILRQSKPFERMSLKGVRYANAAGVGEQEQRPVLDSRSIITAQRDDLIILRKKFQEAIDALRQAIPLAENRQFVPVMLSGRNAFADKMPQFTDMISAFDRFNIRSCMATIDATMQVYPTGFEWLPKSPKDGPP